MADERVRKNEGRRVVRDNEAIDKQGQLGWLQRPAEEHRAALEKIRNGLATRVRILAYHDCCPYCKGMEGAYEFDDVPPLPHEACSHPNGCRCTYAPVLDRFGP